jgi:hypothetical protein
MDHPVEKMDSTDVLSDVQKNTAHPMNPFFPFPFIRFSARRTTLTVNGGTTDIVSDGIRYEGGRFETSHFDGTLPGNYIGEWFKYMERQTGLFLESFTRFMNVR